MNSISKISESELEIMKLLWENSPLSSNDIISALSEDMNWSSQTIKTFLNRLLKKEAIGFEKSGRIYLYYPNVSHEEYVKGENKSFLKRVYDGALDMLFSKFIEDENLSDEDIDRLKSLLDEKKSSTSKENSKE